MDRLGSGVGVGVLFNGRAKRFSAKVVRALEHALPDALILVSEDLEQARRQMRIIWEAAPHLLLSGGGDGAVVQLLNLWREESGGAPFPRIGVLKLGTGNALARVSRAGAFRDLVKVLPRLPRDLPTTAFDLVEAERTLCHFAGVGWDAHVLNDYLRNLDRRSSQLVGSRFASWLHRGVPGYLYATARITVPEERRRSRREGRPEARVVNLGEPAIRIDEQGAQSLVEPARCGEPTLLFEGAIGIGAVSTTPEWGFGFKAFPWARAIPRRMQLRLYDKPVLSAVRDAVRLWRGAMPRPAGLHDYLVSRVKLVFSRPLAFQIGGDAKGERPEIELRVANELAPVVDWQAAREAATSAAPRRGRG